MGFGGAPLASLGRKEEAFLPLGFGFLAKKELTADGNGLRGLKQGDFAANLSGKRPERQA